MSRLRDLLGRLLGRLLGGGEVPPDLSTAAALALTLLALAEARFAGPAGVDDTTAVAVSFAATSPLLLALRYLRWSAVAVCAATAAWLALSASPPITVLIGQMWVLYLVASRFDRHYAALSLIGLVGNAIYPYSGQHGPNAVLLLGLGCVAAVLGNAQRARRHAIADRNAARAETAEVRHDQAVLAERARIARELHDVVAHHVSMMVVQAETARVGTPGLVPQAHDHLEAIRDTGRQALTEMRRLLGVLRAHRDADPTPAAAGHRRPQPGLDSIDELVETARAAGTPVVLRREGGGQRLLPAGVELSGYRIIQEALTNVRRHAPGATAEVMVAFTDDALTIRVRDTGPGLVGEQGLEQRFGQGYGLIGMRERVAMIGGRFRVGQAPGGGFQIEAELPIVGPSS